ncbi:MAG: muramidase (flagellum-specific), partial [candidate division Zixibacteria bacterium]|nr:muramidase (flagellum-specific) [candidate division Zixibacteria bacterium]
ARGAINTAADVIRVKRRLIELGFDWLSENYIVEPAAISAIRLFQAIINGHQRVVGTGVDGVIDIDGITHRWLQAQNAPRWQLLPTGSATAGFINDERLDKSDKHDYGTDWLADTIVAAGSLYLESFLSIQKLAALLTINDASFPQGGDTPDHQGHETGLACDLRLPHHNGNTGGISYRSRSYDQQATRAMLIAIACQPLVSRILFNDPILVAKGWCRQARGHNNHIHVEIMPPDLEFTEVIPDS